MIFTFKSLPDDLMNLFRLSTNVHTTNQTLNSALNNLIHIPKIRTVSYGNHSIRYHCAQLWNQMFRNGSFHIDSNPANDVKLCQVNSIHYFKKKLKQHFLYEYSLQWLIQIEYYASYFDWFRTSSRTLELTLSVFSLPIQLFSHISNFLTFFIDYLDLTWHIIRAYQYPPLFFSLSFFLPWDNEVKIHL